MSKYFNFSEEASRSEFWAVTLICWLTSWVFVFLALLFGGIFAIANELLGGLVALVGIIAVAVISAWLMLSVNARRCNEANISRWWVLPTIIPFIGVIVTIVLGIIPPDPNRIKIKVNDKT